MYLLSDLDFSLPLSNPVIIFALVLFIILFAPIVFNKIKVPHLIGLIVAGIIIGPYGLNLLLRDSSIVLFGTVGLLYIMFTAGLEIDLEEFRKNRFKSLIFGLFTFLMPMLLGSFTAHYLLKFSLPSSLLLSALFSSHTLLAYPITSRYGIARIRSVTLTIWRHNYYRHIGPAGAGRRYRRGAGPDWHCVLAAVRRRYHHLWLHCFLFISFGVPVVFQKF